MSDSDAAGRVRFAAPDSETPSESEATLLLVRHGETIWNAAGRWQGLADPGLTERGYDQARALAERLHAERADRRLDARASAWTRIIASDLERARETAAVLARKLDLAVETDLRLRELDVGDWSGRTRAEIESDDASALARFDSGDPHAPAGGAETRAKLALRVRECVAALAERYVGENLIIVAHLGVLRALVPGAEPTNGEAIRVHLARALSPESSAT